MPPKGKRKYAKKPKYKRRKQFTRTVGAGIVNRFPLPKKFLFKTRYVQSVTIDPSAGGIAASHVFRLNSLYDPDYTTSGHQPVGFDQIMPMYNHYTVIGARARIEFTNRDNSYSQRVFAHVRDSPATITNTSELIENGQCRWTTLGMGPSGQANRMLTMNFSAKKFFGKNVLVEHDYRGTEATDPTECAYLHVTAEPTIGVDSGAIVVLVVLEYIAVLHEPKTLAQS